MQCGKIKRDVQMSQDSLGPFHSGGEVITAEID